MKVLLLLALFTLSAKSSYLIFGLDENYRVIGSSDQICNFCYENICNLSNEVFCHTVAGCRECRAPKYIAFVQNSVNERQIKHRRDLDWTMYGITSGLDINRRLIYNSTFVANTYEAVMDNIYYAFQNFNASWVTLLVQC
jgi:hypothetical protein